MESCRRWVGFLSSSISGEEELSNRSKRAVTLPVGETGETCGLLLSPYMMLLVPSAANNMAASSPSSTDASDKRSITVESQVQAKSEFVL